MAIKKSNNKGGIGTIIKARIRIIPAARTRSLALAIRPVDCSPPNAEVILSMNSFMN
jgi:hypothetical protein